MARINTNVPAIVAQTHLQRSQYSLQDSLERLSSGLRINRGADDPAGLIVSENLRSEISGVGQAVDNSMRASNVIATTEGALNEIAVLLSDIQELVVEAANSGALSDDEIRANQLQIDSAIDSITRIANTTTFAGRQLLNGSLDYILSGVDSSQLASVQVHQAQFGTNTYIPVDIEVTQSAQHGELRFLTSQIDNSITIEVAGNEGVATLSFLSNTTASAIMAAVNIVADSTGVTAELWSAANPNSGIVFRSNGFGSDQWVSVTALPGSGSFTVTDPDSRSVTRDWGQDAAASINGAQSIGRGLDLTLNTTTLDMVISLDPSVGTGTMDFAVVGGGALFQLGPAVNTNQQIGIGVPSVAASRLGNADIGFLSQISTGGEYSLIVGEAAQANRIVDEAIRTISVLRGRLGAFEKNTLQTNINQLQITLENLTSSESTIRDADFAAETAELTRNQILSSAGTSVLAIANQTPQSVLALLQ